MEKTQYLYNKYITYKGVSSMVKKKVLFAPSIPCTVIIIRYCTTWTCRIGLPNRMSTFNNISESQLRQLCIEAGTSSIILERFIESAKKSPCGFSVLTL